MANYSIAILILLVLPAVLCQHDSNHDSSLKEFLPTIVSRLHQINFDLSKFGADEVHNVEHDHHHIFTTEEVDNLSVNIDAEISTAFQGTGKSKLINHLTNQTANANSNRKGALLKTAFYKAGSGIEQGDFRFTLSVDKSLDINNKSITVGKKKLKSCEFKLQKCGIDELRKEFIHVGFDDVVGPFAAKGLVKASVGTSVTTNNFMMSYERNVLQTVVIVGLNKESRAIGSMARILVFGGAKMTLDIKHNGVEKNYLIESAESSIATIKQKQEKSG